MKYWAVSFAAAGLLMSCTTVGPRTNQIVNASDSVVSASAATATAPSKFALIEADRNVAFTWQMFEDTRDVFFKDPGPGRVAIQSGDVLMISLVSVNENGFVDFTTNSVAPVATSNFPTQQVTELGTINVPLVGRLRVAGKTVPSLEEYLDEELSKVLVEPSVVVDLVQRNKALVSVLGAVGAPGAFAYTRGDIRILDLIGLAGGARANLDELQLTLSRNGVTRSAPLADFYRNDRLNIHVRPGDVISVEPRNNAAVVLGAAGSNQQVGFNSTTVPLSQVLGQIGGLTNRRADPRGVFVYRPTPRGLAQMLGVDVRSFPGEDVLAVYQFDMTRPDAFFTVSEFEVRNNDVIYIANSRYEEVDAALDVFSDAVLRPIQIGRALDDE